MKITRHSGSSEKQIVTGMILDPVILAHVAAKWDKENGLFSSKWCNIVAGWCIKYFTKYGKAPKTNIQGIFEDYAEHAKTTESVDMIEAFLDHLSKRAAKLKKNLNTEFILDLANKLFNEVKAKRIIREAEDILENDGAAKFFAKLQEANKIEIGQGSTIRVFSDELAIRKPFVEKRESLVKYPGAAGDFLGDIFERDGLVAFMGAEKIGKTFWLIDVAFRAIKQGRKVAFFQCGDLSQNQIMRRFESRVTKRPMKPDTIRIPTVFDYVHGDLRHVVKEITYDKGLDQDYAFREMQKALKKINGGSKKFVDEPLMLEVYPMNSISVHGIKSSLQNWSRLGWVADIVCIDYADILAPLFGGSGVDSRHQVNATWQALRSISQEFHNCVVTATQVNAASYDKETLDRSNFSEDKRKNAHVTAMIAINQTPDEKAKGQQRLNIIQLREDYFDPTEELLVAGCFAIVNPVMRACRREKAAFVGKDNKK